MELEGVLEDVANGLVLVDGSGKAFRKFKPGVGPYGEPQLLKSIADYLNTVPGYQREVVTKRTPDLLIPGQWALEFKITRPFGDNGKEAENWSVNLLHPYAGNVSSIGDCEKLLRLEGPERLAVIVIGYEHLPAQISLTPLVESFEAIAKAVAHLQLGPRVEIRRAGLVHPVHQCARIFGWQVIGHDSA